ncbi:SDR family oxidoreductase [Nonomuraea sp. NPDC049784]|uniref:SDR family oxidoreductase n=1 Tax=Nonomuraea sp. NPDC049784 TaxID=3154361 RepID=UPI0033DA0762
MLSRSLAQTVGARGITVNAVAPGPTVTDMNPWMLDNPEVQQMVGSGNAIPGPASPPTSPTWSPSWPPRPVAR